MKASQIESIQRTISGIEKQQGSPLTLRQKLFIANHELAHAEKQLNTAEDLVINPDLTHTDESWLVISRIHKEVEYGNQKYQL